MTSGDDMVEQVCGWCTDMLGSTCDNTFGPQTNVYRVGEKIFAMINLGDGEFVTLKALPDEAEALREQYDSVRPGYYMNKRHWITIDLVGEVAMDEIRELVAESHRLVFESLTKKLQAELRSAR